MPRKIVIAKRREIAMPRQMRRKLTEALELTHNKIRTQPYRKHGNMLL